MAMAADNPVSARAARYAEYEAPPAPPAPICIHCERGLITTPSEGTSRCETKLLTVVDWIWLADHKEVPGCAVAPASAADGIVGGDMTRATDTWALGCPKHVSAPTFTGLAAVT
ncbi:hypothetical protein ACCO45_009931 [Purpureocillium lilacinum]|uniref:Uncharacterized protein n=1 Tax=Purpureocillium lilacinum TaxID=33203 RepID=A0ACC4DGE2_PURLI